MLWVRNVRLVVTHGPEGYLSAAQALADGVVPPAETAAQTAPSYFAAENADAQASAHKGGVCA